MARSFAAHGYDVDRWKIDPAVIKDLLWSLAGGGLV